MKILVCQLLPWYTMTMVTDQIYHDHGHIYKHVWSVTMVTDIPSPWLACKYIPMSETCSQLKHGRLLVKLSELKEGVTLCDFSLNKITTFADQKFNLCTNARLFPIITVTIVISLLKAVGSSNLPHQLGRRRRPPCTIWTTCPVGTNTATTHRHMTTCPSTKDYLPDIFSPT